MFENYPTHKEFREKRKVNNIILGTTEKDMYVIRQYEKQMNIDNRSRWISDLIKKDIMEKISLGFVTIS
jgi:hypothetical protein